jgi:hypothetical protein
VADPPKLPTDDGVRPLSQRNSNETVSSPVGMLSGLFPKSAKAPFSWAPDPPPSAPQSGPVSEGGPLPRTWREAIPYVVWVVLVLGFGLEFVAALVHGEWVRAGVSLAGLVALMAAALHWNQIRSWIARTNPNWLYPGLLVLLLAIILSPFIEEKRWPLSAWFQTSGPPIAVHDPPTAEDIAKATAPIRAELEGVKRELATTKGELESVKQQLQAARSAPATGLVLTPEPTPAKQGPITWHVNSQLMLVSGGEPNAVVSGLLFQGTSTASVSIKEAYVVSGLTGRKQTLVANVQSKGGYYPVDKVDIPPGAPVQLDLIFDPGLPLRDFMDQWGKFRVTIIYSNGGPYERDYDEAFVRQQLRQHVPNAFGPRVTPRDDK